MEGHTKGEKGKDGDDSSPLSMPVVDFEAYNLDVDEKETDQIKLEGLSKEIHQALTTLGFLYIKNHGIPVDLITKTFEESTKFFNISREGKQKCIRIKDGNNSGWVDMGQEMLNPAAGTPDPKECFNVIAHGENQYPETTKLPEFRDTLDKFRESCRNLSTRILRLMAMGLQLPDRDFFVKHHNYGRPTCTTLRLLYYPALSDEKPTGSDILCGEHADYGSITLLFQDDVGGLQVKSQGKFIDAQPVPGTIVVNIGDLMQRWSGDRLISSVHRVVRKREEGKFGHTRQSIAYFVHPDSDVPVECLPGGINQYPPITDAEHIAMKFSKSY